MLSSTVICFSSGVYYSVTLGGVGIGWITDLFRIPTLVKRQNEAVGGARSRASDCCDLFCCLCCGNVPDNPNRYIDIAELYASKIIYRLLVCTRAQCFTTESCAITVFIYALFLMWRIFSWQRGLPGRRLRVLASSGLFGTAPILLKPARLGIALPLHGRHAWDWLAIGYNQTAMASAEV